MADNQIIFELLGTATGLNQSIELAQKSFEAAKKILEIPIELAISGEKLKSIETQFELLSSQAGIIGDTLKDSLDKAANGLATTDDLLQASNRAFIELGGNASKLPQTLELARKATIAFGGDLISNFEGINQAIATGNIRSLRALGLSIDREKAEKDYAKTLGVSVSTLSEAGRQQAFLNAVLEKGNTSFKNINDTTLQTTTAWQQLKTAIAEADENFKKSFSNTFGNALSSVATALATEIKRITGTLPLKQQLEEVNDEIQRIKSSGLAESMGGALQTLETRARALNNQLELGRIAQQDALVAQRRLGNQTAGAAFIDPEKAEADRLRVREVYSHINSDLVNAQLQQAQLENNSDAVDNLRFQQRFQVIQEFELRKQQIKRDFFEKGLIDRAAFEEIEVQLEAEKNAKIKAMELQANAVLLSVRKALQDGLTNAIATSIKSIVTNLAQGASAFKDFGKTLLGLLGGLAIQIGTMILAAGIAKSTLITDLFGGPTVIAGATLIAIGAALEAFAGSGGSSVSDSGGGGVGAGGGVALGTDGASPAAAITSLNASKTGTSVNINIAGNVLDRREFGLEIANVMQEHFNNNGSLIVGGNF